MKKTKVFEPPFTNAEMDLLNNAIQLALGEISDRSKNIIKLISEGEHYGFIPTSGDNWTKYGKPLYDLKDSIVNAQEADAQKIRDLRNKIYRLNTQQ